MLHGKDIICISSIDWDFVWQGHQEIMTVLSKNSNRVLFVENTGVRSPTIKDAARLWRRFQNWRKGYKGIRKIADNLYVYSPLVLPFPYSRIARVINRLIMLSVLRNWMNAIGFRNPVIWSFLPTGIVMDIVREFSPSIFIYYCIDDFAASSKGARGIRPVEERAIKRADLVFTTSHKLYDRCAGLNKNTHLFPFGVSISHYDEAREGQTEIPPDIKKLPKPIIGYIGGIHQWIDMDLIRRMASALPEFSFVLVGPKQTDYLGIDTLPNVFLTGQRAIRELPLYVKNFDACMIPYLITQYTDNVYPTKINEYLAMGKPVISTAIPEVVKFNETNGGDFIWFISSGTDIRRTMEEALKDNDKETIERRIAVAHFNSWSVKIDQMCDIIVRRMSELEKDIGREWLKRFRHFYSAARGKTIRLAAIGLIGYFTLFYTPLVWLAASPLKIDDHPRHSDAIVVFGGGVGETGSPGKSTIERARYSVDLYKAGFAKYIIYSSGYTYKYNDAENMKLFAISMGVPESNIILEKQANSTYENVRYVNEILKEKGFGRIILVTSPYNMLRASLVFKHAVKDMDVIYSSVPDPEFYVRYGRVEISQIRAILHEYLGIVYYFVKGYI